MTAPVFEGSQSSACEAFSGEASFRLKRLRMYAFMEPRFLYKLRLASMQAMFLMAVTALPILLIGIFSGSLMLLNVAFGIMWLGLGVSMALLLAAIILSAIAGY